MVSNRAETMPVECKSLGFAGYEAAGLTPPRESIWVQHLTDRLWDAGCAVTPNIAGAMHSGLPDSMLHTNSGLFYMEFKGLDTPVRGNQALVAKSMNSKSLYSRGEIVCMIYRAPDSLGILRSDRSILEVYKVDALSDPEKFVNSVYMIAQPVVIGTRTDEVTELISELGIAKMQRANYRVTKKTPDSVEEIGYVLTYTHGLALKQLTGLNKLTADVTSLRGTTYLVEELVVTRGN